jgi:hypothetical protein
MHDQHAAVPVWFFIDVLLMIDGSIILVTAVRSRWAHGHVI